MRKIIIFGSLILALLVAIAALTEQRTAQQSEGNPFGKTRLNSETIAQLDDPNYQNIVIPEDLQETLNSNDETFVYFYSPTCEFCREATPILSPLAEDMNVDLLQYNLLEFEEGWSEYGIEYTPTIIYFSEEEEMTRMIGLHDENTYRQFFEQAEMVN